MCRVEESYNFNLIKFIILYIFYFHNFLGYQISTGRLSEPWYCHDIYAFIYVFKFCKMNIVSLFTKIFNMMGRCRDLEWTVKTANKDFIIHTGGPVRPTDESWVFYSLVFDVVCYFNLRAGTRTHHLNQQWHKLPEAQLWNRTDKQTFAVL